MNIRIEWQFSEYACVLGSLGTIKLRNVISLPSHIQSSTNAGQIIMNHHVFNLCQSPRTLSIQIAKFVLIRRPFPRITGSKQGNHKKCG